MQFLEHPLQMGADRFVITCVTMHYVLPRVPLELRERVISLLDIIVDLIKSCPGKALLLCTEGTRETQLFERHPGWDQVRNRVVLPSPKDQRKIHRLIYESLKPNRFDEADEQRLRQLAAKYEVRALIAGCTEFHLLHERFATQGEGSRKIRLIDPLIHLARNLEAYLEPVTRT
jgi:aspartate racemase